MAGDLCGRLCALPGVLTCETGGDAVVLAAAAGTDARLLKGRAQVVCADVGETRAVEVHAAPVPTARPTFSGPAAALRRADRPLAVATASLVALVAIALMPSGEGPSVGHHAAQIASASSEALSDPAARAPAPSSRTTSGPRSTSSSGSLPSALPFPLTKPGSAGPDARRTDVPASGSRGAASPATPGSTGSKVSTAATAASSAQSGATAAGAGDAFPAVTPDASRAASPAPATGAPGPPGSVPVTSVVPASASPAPSDDSCEQPGNRPATAGEPPRDAPPGGGLAAGAKPPRTTPSRPAPGASADHVEGARPDKCGRGGSKNEADPAP